MKVYCGDCKYYGDYGNEMDMLLLCAHPDNQIKVDSPSGQKWTCKGYPDGINNDNNCQWFKPKWYRRGKYRNR